MRIIGTFTPLCVLLSSMVASKEIGGTKEMNMNMNMYMTMGKKSLLKEPSLRSIVKNVGGEEDSIRTLLKTEIGNENNNHENENAQGKEASRALQEQTQDAGGKEAVGSGAGVNIPLQPIDPTQQQGQQQNPNQNQIPGGEIPNANASADTGTKIAEENESNSTLLIILLLGLAFGAYMAKKRSMENGAYKGRWIVGSQDPDDHDYNVRTLNSGQEM